jgi:hypothetical protein
MIYPRYWVPKLNPKLTRPVWYTLGTAHDFAREWPCNRGLPSKSLSRTAVEKWAEVPRGHPHRALD